MYHREGSAVRFLGGDFMRPCQFGLNGREQQLIGGIKQLACNEVRPPAVVALVELHGGRVKQGNTESASQYIQRFLTRATALPDESQANL